MAKSVYTSPHNSDQDLISKSRGLLVICTISQTFKFIIHVHEQWNSSEDNLAIFDGSFTDGDVIHWYWKRKPGLQ
ncbi:hypothetical protein A6R68_23197 [Neotoma lepida]|uniref:Uncharacterized protein n=1 Tax=Neotoma lepida TaxID=56216 RepID=A0A1A6HYL8_NEOLE|nr:hypothetical protein A6R68_23197 [Neotoma lepida]